MIAHLSLRPVFRTSGEHVRGCIHIHTRWTRLAPLSWKLQLQLSLFVQTVNRYRCTGVPFPFRMPWCWSRPSKKILARAEHLAMVYNSSWWRAKVFALYPISRSGTHGTSKIMLCIDQSLEVLIGTSHMALGISRGADERLLWLSGALPFLVSQRLIYCLKL